MTPADFDVSPNLVFVRATDQAQVTSMQPVSVVVNASPLFAPEGIAYGHQEVNPSVVHFSFIGHPEWSEEDKKRFNELLREKASIKGPLPSELIQEFTTLQEKRRQICYAKSAEQIVWDRRRQDAIRKLKAVIDEYLEFF